MVGLTILILVTHVTRLLWGWMGVVRLQGGYWVTLVSLLFRVRRRLVFIKRINLRLNLLVNTVIDRLRVLYYEYWFFEWKG